MKSLLLAMSGTSLLAVAAALCCFVAVRVVTSVPERFDPAAGLEQSQAEERDETDSSSRSPRSKIYYAAILERPLFAPERRPRTPDNTGEEHELVMADEPVSSSERPAISLHGVMVDANGSKALISAAEESPQWVPTGDKIREWTLSEIGPDWVELRLATETFRIEMYQ
ncbi:hypothetical protein [Ruegeria halocynthiae]|uniref:hypothetical protein n=1 Tax=Ruegeria halocynthiae TaxID=985054 RepID=UPI00055EE96D|nr:hypothetical protein [Ruegeria halocynthiae]